MLGTQDLLIALALGVFLFGAKKLPELARGLGESLKEFKRATTESDPPTPAPPRSPAPPSAPTVVAPAGPRCPRCQAELQADWAHCPRCGAARPGA
jgi:sec-independent protein translocase protein TatA